MSQPKDQTITRLSNLYSRISKLADPGLLVAALLALFAVWPLLAFPGLPNTADGPAHLMRQAELNQAWQDGILYPRWAPDLAYGYGMPLFHYAPPLLYYVTQVFHVTGLPLDTSMKGTIILMMVLYSIGMYLFGRDLFGPRAGLLAAAIYLYAPYRLREAYIQGNYGQFCGLAFYPLILWAFRGLVMTGRRRYSLLGALSLAGLLLSHNISAMIFAPLFGAYLVFLLILERLEIRELGIGVKQVIVALAVGLGLSAFFWLPAFGERDLVRLAGITSGFFDFRHNFISLTELLAWPCPLDLAAINPYFPLSLGLAQVAFAALALAGVGVYCVLRIAYCVLRIAYCVLRTAAPTPPVDYQHKVFRVVGHALFFAVALLVTAFLTLPESAGIWELVPLLELAEFPWRWLGPAVLCAAVLAGAVLCWLDETVAVRWSLTARSLGLLVALAFIVGANLFYLFPNQFISWGTPGPADALAYEAETGAIGTTSAGEFLPRWTDRYPSPDVLGPDYAAGRLPTKLDPASLPEGASAITLGHTARETRVAVNSPAPFLATFRALYWPGWHATLVHRPEGDRGDFLDLQVTQPDGLIQVELPAGDYQVSLRLFPTPIRRVAVIVSLVSVVVLLWQLGSWVIGWLDDPVGPSALPAFQALIIALALIGGLVVTRPMAGWFRVQSPPDQVYGAQYQAQVDLGDQVRLLAYDLPTRPSNQPSIQPTIQPIPKGPRGAIHPSNLPMIHAQPGDTLPVVLYWRALEPLGADYSVFVHLDALDGRTYAGADEVNPEDIPSSHWPPSLYVRNPLTLDLPADLPPIRYTLTTGLYDPENGERLIAAACQACPSGNTIPLAHVWIQPSPPLEEEDIPHRLDYRLAGVVSLLGYKLDLYLRAGIISESTSLTLYWRAEAPVEKSYVVFIHALDAGGELVGQFDAPPVGGLYPTDAWWPGQIIADAHSLVLPETTQTLAIGLYDPTSLTRVPATGKNGERLLDDAIRLQVADNN